MIQLTREFLLAALIETYGGKELDYQVEPFLKLGYETYSSPYGSILIGTVLTYRDANGDNSKSDTMVVRTDLTTSESFIGYSIYSTRIKEIDTNI